jgi:hypothetical protein
VKTVDGIMKENPLAKSRVVPRHILDVKPDDELYLEGIRKLANRKRE